jgi:hypothetical protein
MTSANVSTRKPHAGNAGFSCERKARLGGHIVVYDRKAGFDCDAGERWIVQHEPSGRHVAIATERHARETMKALAEAPTLHAARLVADLFPGELEADQVDETPAAAAPANPAAVDQALERFFSATTFAEERAAWRDLVEASPTKKDGRR